MVPGFLSRGDAPFHDAVLERYESMLLFVMIHRGRQMRRVAVQPIEMRRIDRVLHRLEPVATVDLVLLDPALAVLPRQHVPARQQRPRRRPKICPQKSAQFFDRIGDVLDLVLEAAFLRLGGLLEASSRAVEFPAMIATANAFLVDAAKSQRRFAMRAVLADHAVASRFVAIHDKILAQETNRLDRLLIGQFRGNRDRHPVAPQQPPAARARSDAGQHVIFFAGEHDALLLFLRRCHDLLG